MTVLLGYFLIAAIAGVATSAIIGFVLTSLFIARVDKGDGLAELNTQSLVSGVAGDGSFL